MEENKPYQPYEDEITLKELILKIQEYWRELWNNWWMIGLITLPFIGYYVFKTLTHTPVYNAEVRFIVEGQGGSGLSGLGGLLGSFGLNRSAGGKVNPYKIIEVAKSKRMIGSALFNKSTVNEDFLANNIISEYKLNDVWAKNIEELADFKFHNKKVESFGELERVAFLSVYHKTVGTPEDVSKALLKINLNEDNGIFNILSITESEQLSLDLANNLYDNLKVFFEQEILEDQLKSRNILKGKSDSLYTEISTKNRSIAQFEDTSRGLISRQAEADKNRMTIELQGLSTAYAEVQKSLILADYELQNLKPLFLVIDQPYSPIRPYKESLIKNIILGCLLGGFIGTGFVISRKIYREALDT